MNKKYLGIYVKCPKGTNNCPWEEMVKDKVLLCSKHYREWLNTKDKHYTKAVKEFLNHG